MTAHRGNRMPAGSVAQLDFATGTPYGARFTRAPVAPQRMRWPPIVDAAHQLLHDALQGGTAKLLAQGIMYADGRTLDAYGETATGARLIAADKVNRAATLVFVTGGGFFWRADRLCAGVLRGEVRS